MKKNYTRRLFLKQNSLAGLGSMLLAGCGIGRDAAINANTHSSRKPVIDEYDPANIKLCHRLKANASEDDMLFLKQIGVRWVRAEFARDEGSFAHIQALQNKLARYDIRIYSATHGSYNSPLIHLGKPGRDQDIETYRTFLRHLGRLGISTAAYSFHTATTYGTGMVQHRGYTAREFDLAAFRSKVEKMRYDREYTDEEIWSAYSYFIKAILPVAEEADVKLALHPDDPPLPKMNGVAKIFSHYDGLKRAEQITGGSTNWGLCFCAGTWGEGGEHMGKSIIEMIRDFGKRGKIFEVHFRNVTSPLPKFNETFPDDGYMDMYQIMKALRQAGINGAVMPDHVPHLVGDQGILRAGTAYCIAYMRALLRRANEEVG